MMPNSARQTDLWTGICYQHSPPIATSGIIIGCSANVLVNGLGQARIGDQVISFCGHTGIIITGSSTVLTNAIPNARVGDTVAGGVIGTIIQGSENVTKN